MGGRDPPPDSRKAEPVRMSLRCVYTDLDGTLLGAGASLFADHEGGFSMMQAKALQACDRAGVEVVIMSGRRRVQVHEDARLIGQTSFIFEAGSAFSIDGETFMATGDFVARRRRDPGRAGLGPGCARTAARALRRPVRVPRAVAPRPGDVPPVPGRGRYRRGEPVCSKQAATATCACSTTARSAGRCPASKSPTSTTWSPREPRRPAVAAHSRARGYVREETIAVGDSLEDLEAANSVGRFFMVANGPERDTGVRAALAAFPNATVTEGRGGDGFYEAVITTLMA